MKKIFTKFFLFAALLAASTNLSAQTYNGGTWYSLFDTKEYAVINVINIPIPTATIAPMYGIILNNPIVNAKTTAVTTAII